jgi:pyruvate/2-oxoglutarate dehydrogenase complex dihydrolipoamide acyltransferase (E2) component
MAIEIILPKLGFAMNEGEIKEWLVPDGAAVVEGQAIYTLESEKAVQEVEAPATGTLRIIAEPGELHVVGTVVGEIL